jgi:hypothetical protein
MNARPLPNVAVTVGFVRRILDLRERAVEALQDAIELHPHLERQRVPGVVIGRPGRPARVQQIVGIVLRLEHVEHVGPERLRGLHNVGAGRIRLARDGERGGGAAARPPPTSSGR